MLLLTEIAVIVSIVLLSETSLTDWASWGLFERIKWEEFCGACGYELNLSSSSRNIVNLGSKYGKSIKRGIISFLNVDESRFTQVDAIQCIPYYKSKRSWGLFRRRIKLLCRKCGNHVGYASDENASVAQLASDGSESTSGSESTCRKYNVRIRALQPSSPGESGIPLCT
ncbi:hypothetical protein RJ641_029408 [Dillenia turbinata]|uniref:Uncharacterized protein n=1 Tax=Dillenia turbinata TaxID=194707 RepID=A0AAN8W1P0_9MAGN